MKRLGLVMLAIGAVRRRRTPAMAQLSLWRECWCAPAQWVLQHSDKMGFVGGAGATSLSGFTSLASGFACVHCDDWDARNSTNFLVVICRVAATHQRVCGSGVTMRRAAPVPILKGDARTPHRNRSSTQRLEAPPVRRRSSHCRSRDPRSSRMRAGRLWPDSTRRSHRACRDDLGVAVESVTRLDSCDDCRITEGRHGYRSSGRKPVCGTAPPTKPILSAVL